MCGIAGIHVLPKAKGQLPVGRMLDNLLLGIEHRGREATGFVAVSFDNQIEIDKGPVIAREFIKRRRQLRGQTQTVIAHTRLATKGPITANENNHPVTHGSTFVTHNGVIWNDDDLFRQYAMERLAEVDSVAIPAMIESFGWERAADALEKLEGMMAIAAIDVTKQGELLLARGSSSPLCVIRTDKFIAWASTVEALKCMWAACFGTPPKAKKFEILKEGDMLFIKDGVVTELEFTPQEPWYSKTYTSTASKSQGYTTIEEWEGTKKGTAGYWKVDSGVRTYVEGTASSYDKYPTQEALKTAHTYSQWAGLEVEIDQRAIEELSYEVDLDYETVAWLIHLSDLKALSEPMIEVYDFLIHRYGELWDAMFEKRTAQNAKAAVSDNLPVLTGTVVEEGLVERNCLDCGEPTLDFFRCDSCKQRMEMAEIGVASDTLLAEALAVTDTEEELEEYLAERRGDTLQAAAEAAREEA